MGPWRSHRPINTGAPEQLPYWSRDASADPDGLWSRSAGVLTGSEGAKISGCSNLCARET